MRVAILSLYDFEEVRGGTELFVRFLRRVFPDSTNINYAMSKDEFVKMDLRKLNLEPVKKGMAISRHFARLNRLERYDVVVCNNVAGLGMKLFDVGVPAVQVFHYTYKGFSSGAMFQKPGYYASRYLLPWFERAAAQDKKVVAVSHKTRRELERLYGLSAHVIENGVDTDKFYPRSKEESRERLGIKFDGPIGIFVGRADYTKGFDVLQQLARKRKDMKILCVTGSKVEEEAIIVAHNVDHEDMPLYYSAADFLVFPSRYEAASYSAIEAMACDLPIIAYRTGLFEDIEEGMVGRVLEEVTMDAFSKGIDDVLRTNRYHTRELAKRRFSMERFAQDYQRLAEDVVAGRS